MVDSTQFVKHIELYVSSSATSSEQAASVYAVAALLKNDLLTLEALVREMEMYLTTSDSIIRSRGILLLAEVVEQLSSKPLSRTSIHTLIGFFAERLADWRAVRGAIVGCLAILKRKIDVAAVNIDEAKAVAKSLFECVQVQTMGQHDRKLSFQLMECLVDRYSDAIQDLGDQLITDGICEAIDGEKDPECLLLVFRIVESLVRKWPSSSVSEFAEPFFELIGDYFPIHFTHTKGEDDNMKKEELSRALMCMMYLSLSNLLLLAFASTPQFEPFSIPLLLEKLSSSLPSAQVESLKYLSYCTAKYGPEKMIKYYQALWSSVKDKTYVSPQCTLSVDSEQTSGMCFKNTDVMTLAFQLLQEVIRQERGFIDLITGDDDLNIFLNSLAQYRDHGDISLEVKQRLHAVGHILSACVKFSVDLCNKIFDSFFPVIMDALGLIALEPSDSNCLDLDSSPLCKLNFGALYLFVELLVACRNFTLSLEFAQIPNYPQQTWCAMLGSFSQSLVAGLLDLLRSNVADAQSDCVYLVVKGLQILATFPGSFPAVSKVLYDDILLEFVLIVTSDFSKKPLWTMGLKALVEIGLFVDKYPDPERAATFKSIVVERIVALMISDDSAMPLSLKLQAAFDIGTTGKDNMMKVIRGLDEAILIKLTAVYDHVNRELGVLTIKLLDAYSQLMLPRLLEIGDPEEIPLKFALRIWEMIEKSSFTSLCRLSSSSDFLGAMMTAMKMSVASCSKERQEIIINKAFGILCSSYSLKSIDLKSGSSMGRTEAWQPAHNFRNSSCEDELLISLFASVIIALRPQTIIPDAKLILQLFISSLVSGHVPAAHALGSLVNKLPIETTDKDLPDTYSLNEALELLLPILMETSEYEGINGKDGGEADLIRSRLDASRGQTKINIVVGLAWLGKGLLMRGHEKVKDATLTLFSFLTLDCKNGEKFEDMLENCGEEHTHQLLRSAGDAFHIIMSDSGECLNKTYHAIIRPLYKQRFFNTVLPIFVSLIARSEESIVRSMLCRAFAHVVTGTPLTAVLGEAKKLVPILLNCLSVLSKDIKDKDVLYSVLLVISGILVEENGKDAAVENAPGLVDQLIELTVYKHMMAIRETAIQCLVAMTQLPHTRIFPLRTKVLRATLKALDDPKKVVRQEAVRCRHAWASTT